MAPTASLPESSQPKFAACVSASPPSPLERDAIGVAGVRCGSGLVLYDTACGPTWQRLPLHVLLVTCEAPAYRVEAGSVASDVCSQIAAKMTRSPSA
jgi:hypothetical protein